MLAAFLAGGAAWANYRQPCANTETCHRPYLEQLETNVTGTFLGQLIAPPTHTPINAQPVEPSRVLGESTESTDKHIYIDLDAQTLYAYEQGVNVQTSLISSGRWGWTPLGNFNIQSKFKSTRMAGGSGSTYYNLPNVPYTMFFNGDFGIHGAYWHNNFGTPMSHGCVNMRTIDAQQLFAWADGPTKSQKGTPVSICQSFIAPDTCIQNEKTHMPKPAALPESFGQPMMQQASPDGSRVVLLDVKYNPDDTKTYEISISQTATGEAQLLASPIIPNTEYLNVPFNSWSPDTAYFFIERKSADGGLVDALIFKASAGDPETTNQEPLLIAPTFRQKKPDYAIDRVTGWASPRLLVINSYNSELARGPSFWFEVPSRALIQLSQEF